MKWKKVFNLKIEGKNLCLKNLLNSN